MSHQSRYARGHAHPARPPDRAVTLLGAGRALATGQVSASPISQPRHCISHAPLLLLVAVAALAVLPTGPAQSATRCRALDGDTVRCGRERIRLRDVHAAEKGAPGSAEERRNLQRKLDSGDVRIRRHGKDAYGRTLGDVYVGGRKVTQRDIGPRGGHGAERTRRSHSPRR